MTHFIHKNTHRHTLPLSLPLVPSSLSSSPPSCLSPFAKLKKNVPLFFLFFLSSITFSRPVLAISPALPPSHPAICANQSHQPLSISPSPNLFPSPCITADVLKSPLFSRVSAHLVQPCIFTFTCAFFFSLAGVCVIFTGEMSQKAYLCWCYSVCGTAVLGYTCHIPCIITNAHSNTFSLLYFSLFFSHPLLFFSEPLLRQQPVISTAHPLLFFFTPSLPLQGEGKSEEFRDG